MNVYIFDSPLRVAGEEVKNTIACFFEGRICVFTVLDTPCCDLDDHCIYAAVADYVGPYGLPETTFYHWKAQPLKLYLVYMRLEEVRHIHFARIEVRFDSNAPLWRAIMQYLRRPATIENVLKIIAAR